MNVLKKVRYLKARKEKEKYMGPYFLDISVEENHWKRGEIESLQEIFPWLPQSYLSFIKEFDSLGLGWVTFFGSKNAGIISIWEEIEYWKNNSKDHYFPFGKDADGSIYTFNRKGEVIYFSIDDHEWKNPVYIAENLESFINECLLGKRFHEFNNIEKSQFYPFLKAQGWV